MMLHASETDTPSELPFAMYDAFTSVPYSGSQAAIVTNAASISQSDRTRIAREIGVPATSFVSAIDGNRIKVQFFSTVMELPMCGHGTVCLITRLVDSGFLPGGTDNWQSAILDLPNGEATVEYRFNAAGRIEVMLDVAAATFAPATLDHEELARLLGVSVSDFRANTPIEVASADFVHLCLPMRDLAAMGRFRPDFPALAEFCRANSLGTIATFSIQCVNSDADLHVRDFCPAVGVAESAAAGTTNAALAGYLIRNSLVEPVGENRWCVRAEQGMEMGRPSRVTTSVRGLHGKAPRIQVGGVASRILEGNLNIMMGSK